MCHIIETKNFHILVALQQLQELNKKFASASIKLYYVKIRFPVHFSNLKIIRGNLGTVERPIVHGDKLVRTSRNNALIDTVCWDTWSA